MLSYLGHHYTPAFIENLVRHMAQEGTKPPEVTQSCALSRNEPLTKDRLMRFQGHSRSHSPFPVDLLQTTHFGSVEEVLEDLLMEKDGEPDDLRRTLRSIAPDIHKLLTSMEEAKLDQRVRHAKELALCKDTY